MFRICCAESMQIWSSLRTFADEFNDSRELSADWIRIFKKQNNTGRVAKIMHCIYKPWLETGRKGST
jgi:hypothetical protein